MRHGGRWPPGTARGGLCPSRGPEAPHAPPTSYPIGCGLVQARRALATAPPCYSGATVETTVRIEALQRSLEGCLRALGFASEAAARMAEVFVDSELRGYDDHGAIMIQFYAGWVRSGEVDPRARLETVRETPGTALLEGHRADGVTSATAAMRLAMAKARAAGVGCVSLRHTGHFVAGAPYVELAAREGFIGLACANSNNLMAPPGSNTRVLGTNPLAVGLPAATHEPVVFDMATSAIAGGKIRMLGLAGQAVPSGILLDAAGKPTTVADDYLQRGGSILPLGGEHALHKGFGLSMLVDALAGVLPAPASPRPRARGQTRRARDGSSWRSIQAPSCPAMRSPAGWTSRLPRSRVRRGCPASMRYSCPASAACDAGASCWRAAP